MSTNEKYIHALKRELNTSRGKKDARARDEILAELARHGAGDTVRTATTDQPVKRGPGRPKKQAE